MQIQHRNKALLTGRKKFASLSMRSLIPWEIEAEMNQGVIPASVSKSMLDRAVALGLSKMDAPTAAWRLWT